MSTSGIAGHPASVGAGRGHRFGVWSLMMLPFLVVSGVAAGIIGVVLLGLKNLEGSEPMSEQGGYGWMVFALATIIFMSPMIIGVVLGAKARNLGERKLGTIGMIVDGAILVGYTALALYGYAT